MRGWGCPIEIAQKSFRPETFGPERCLRFSVQNFRSDVRWSAPTTCKAPYRLHKRRGTWRAYAVYTLERDVRRKEIGKEVEGAAAV